MSNIIEQIEKSNIELSNKKLPPLVLVIVYLFKLMLLKVKEKENKPLKGCYSKEEQGH